MSPPDNSLICNARKKLFRRQIRRHSREEGGWAIALPPAVPQFTKP